MLLSLFHLLLADVLHGLLLLRPETLIHGLELHPPLSALKKLLGLAVLVFLLLHLVILEHAPVHHHVHIPLEQGRSQPLI